MEGHHARPSIYVVQFRKDVEIAGGISETTLRRAFEVLARPKKEVLDERYGLRDEILNLVRDGDPERTFKEVGVRLGISEWMAERREKQGIFLMAHVLQNRLPSYDRLNYVGTLISPEDD